MFEPALRELRPLILLSVVFIVFSFRCCLRAPPQSHLKRAVRARIRKHRWLVTHYLQKSCDGRDRWREGRSGAAILIWYPDRLPRTHLASGIDGDALLGLSCGDMARTMKHGALAHGAAVQLALCMLSDGRAKSKTQAAQLAGIDQTSLRPQNLARFAARNPIGRQLSQISPQLLEITAEVGGKRISTRTALSSGVESAIQILAKLGPRLAKLTKTEDARFQRAKRWLELSRSCGLFAAPAPLALPSELGQATPDSAPDHDPVEGALSDFTEDGDSPAGDEASAPNCKVEA